MRRLVLGPAAAEDAGWVDPAWAGVAEEAATAAATAASGRVEESVRGRDAEKWLSMHEAT